MNLERDKFLTEAMGECWHDFEWHIAGGNKCKHCALFIKHTISEYPGHNPKNIPIPEHNDFSTWEGFGKLWEWAQKQSWFDLFQCNLYYHDYTNPKRYTSGDEHNDNEQILYNDYIHPDRFADALYSFLEKKGEES